MRRSSEVTSDGQMDHGQVRKPRISRQKPVTWPDTAFGHLTGYVFVGQTWPRPGASAGGLGSADQTGHALGGRGGSTSPRPGALARGVGRTSPRPGELAGGVGKDRAGQRRTKRALVRQEHRLLWRTPAAKCGQRRSNADRTCCFRRLFAKGRVANLATYPGQTRTK